MNGITIRYDEQRGEFVVTLTVSGLLNTLESTGPELSQALMDLAYNLRSEGL